MPKLPQLSAREVLAALKKAGFEVKRQSGSHVILENANGHVVVVPNHNPIKRGTLQEILHQASLTPEQLLDYLE
ncbi:type II toxin-antitoxin system HicA family toxin [Alicyclobacillus shizuokensis]|uniref:type II toxin-antitoxin system HicA family toxin n=1 Tax=Alicyclobacillus shizuokensis TaxID=392014 RepID=UPI00082B8B47|nr:type II toxin-antitoxin system HicA family toxin [Alicyclobacillus shizuokensis]